MTIRALMADDRSVVRQGLAGFAGSGPEMEILGCAEIARGEAQAFHGFVKHGRHHEKRGDLSQVG